MGPEAVEPELVVIAKELADTPRVGWQHLRSFMRGLAQADILASVPPDQAAALYIVRAFVGDVWYNLMAGDSQREAPTEGPAHEEFVRMTESLSDFLSATFGATTVSGSLSPFGQSVKAFYAAIRTIDDQHVH